MDAQAYLAERTPLVDAVLDHWLPPAERPPRALHQAMRHLVFPGGKRLRPALAMAAAEAAGARPQAALPAAAAVELVHTYSLIHDDLPCMDDDVERRGRPTVHVAFGEPMAVLAGDALLALAFECLSAAAAEAIEAASDAATRPAPTPTATHTPAHTPAPAPAPTPTHTPTPQAIARAVSDLACAAGPGGLVGGQADDLESGATEPAHVESVHERKTAALIRAALLTGARLAGADETLLSRLGRFGLVVGVAFQIADDLLDAGEDDACSLVTVLGPEAACSRAESLLGEALAEIEDLGERAEPLRALARFAVRRSR